MQAIAFAASASESSRVGWTDDDYNGLFVLKALRRKSFSGRCVVQIGGVPVGVRSAERELALRWFVNEAHSYLYHQKVQTPLCLIPVPNLGATDGAKCDTVEQAEALAKSIGNEVSVLDVVRWSEPLEAQEDAGYYFQRAVVNGGGPDGARKTTVLVDEMCHGNGAALQAVAAKLRQSGINVDFALCAGFVPPGEPPSKVFQPHVLKLDDYQG